MGGGARGNYGSSRGERDSYSEVVLEQRLRDTLAQLNPRLPGDAFRKLTHPEGATFEARNRAFHRMFVEGVTVEYRTIGGDSCDALTTESWDEMWEKI